MQEAEYFLHPDPAPEDWKIPSSTPFRQQQLKGWTPIWTPPVILTAFVVLGCVFLPLGALVLFATTSVAELRVPYHNQVPLGENATLSVIVPEAMDPPIFLYYELGSVYQNHRSYVNSRSDSQLRGELGGDLDVQKCDPLIKNKFNGSLTIYPCGLIASSFFNDWFTVAVGNQTIALDKNIAVSSDVKQKFHSRPLQSDETQFGVQKTSSGDQAILLPNVDDPDFIVWMRVAGLAPFKKLYGKISRPLMASEVLNITIGSHFDVNAWRGEKWVVFATRSFMGGMHSTLGYTCCAASILFFGMALWFEVLFFCKPKNPGQILVW